MSDSGWSFVSYHDQHEQQIHDVIKTQEARLQQASGGMLGWARLGASTTRVQIENPNPLPPPPALLPLSATIAAPAPTAAGAPAPSKQRDSKKAAAKEFPRTEEGEKAGREPCEFCRLQYPDFVLTASLAKGPSLGRRIKTSLLGGKRPVLPDKVTEREKQGKLTRTSRSSETKLIFY